MEETTSYEVEITSSGKVFYFEVLELFYTYSSTESAAKKADELYEKALSLSSFPERGQREETLKHLSNDHRYILYQTSSGLTIKIIYFIDKVNLIVYVIDFFSTRMDNEKLPKRSKS